MNEERLTYRIAMSLLPGIDTGVADRLLAEFGSEKAAMEATETELHAITGVGRTAASAQARFKAIETGRRETEYIARNNVRAVWYQDDDYPRRLMDTDSGPLMIYMTGECDLNARPTVSIVGTRHATSYGETFTDCFVAELAEINPEVVIVSGLAYGIDVAAHRAALKAGVATAAVVAHGISTLYPAQHRDIASRMVSNGGAIITQYTHDIKPLRPHFLERNRLVALLGDALVVVESAERGGALSTAHHAARAGRPVFAPPGRVTDTYSIGCNNLIAKGAARLLSTATDVAEYLGWAIARKEETKETGAEIPALTPDEIAIARVIQVSPLADNDTISAATGLAAHIVMATAIGLEMKGVISSTGGNRYQLLLPIDFNKI